MIGRDERGRLSQLERTAKLISVLVAGRELARTEIAELLELQPAAADRQLRAIGRHLPLIRNKRGGRAYFRLDRSAAARTSRPPIGTIIAACLGASLSKLFRGTQYESAMIDAVQRLGSDAAWPERLRNVRRQFVFVIRGGEKALPEAQAVLDDVVDAVLRGFYVRIRYIGFEGKPRTETIQPLSLAVYDHQLYVLAIGDTGRVHPYRFARIVRATKTTKRFSYPDKDNYEPERIFADSFGVFVDPQYELQRVELSLDRRWANYVKSHRWHSSQETYYRRGRLHLALSVRVCPEVIAWILGFGADARVVGPRSVRDRVATTVKAMARSYR